MSTPKITSRDARLLYLPESPEVRFLPEGPTALGGGMFSWVAIQHGPEAVTGSLNVFDLKTGRNQQFNLPGRPGFAKPTQQEGVFVVGCERSLGIFRVSDQSWQVICEGIDSGVDNTIINDGTCFGDNLVFGCKDLDFKTKKLVCICFVVATSAWFSFAAIRFAATVKMLSRQVTDCI